MAESIALRDTADLFKCASAGLNALGVVQKQTLQTLETNGYPTDGLYSKRILNDAWADADLVINMSGYPRETGLRAATGTKWRTGTWKIPTARIRRCISASLRTFGLE